MAKVELDDTIAEGKAFLRENAEKGTECPCCGQFVKIYRRKLNSAMACALVYLYKRENREADEGWIHVENYLKSQNIPASIRGDFPKLRYWGLIEQFEGQREDGSTRVGLYRITEKGELFVEGQLAVNKYILLYNQKLLGRDGDATTIQDALGDKFNYEELMKG